MKFWLLFLVIPIVALDQITKRFALAHLHVTCNRGFAFGFAEGFSNIWIPVLILAAIAVLLFAEKNTLRTVSFVLVLAGGLSNLASRLTGGCVADFINLGFWPAFNFADSAITIGVALLVIETAREMKFLK